MSGKSNRKTRKPVAGDSNAESARLLAVDSAIEDLFNISLDMLCVADFEGYFRLINPAFETTLGYDRRELLETPFFEFVHPDDRNATQAVMAQLANGESVNHFENRYRCGDGSYKWLSWTAVPAVSERFAYATARDVTEQKAVQHELAAQRDLFNKVLNTVPASIFWKDRNSILLGANDRFVHEVGLNSLDEVVGKTDFDLACSNAEAAFYRACDREVMDSGIPLLHIEETQQRSDGETVHLLTSKVPLTDASGEVSGLLGIYVDITARKQTEATLRKSEARLQTLFDSAAEFIFVIDREGKIIKANRRVFECSGHTETDIIGARIKDFFTRESQQICDCNFPKLRENGYNRADVNFVCKDGRVIDMECSATAVPDENGEYTSFMIVQRDVTERNKTAAALAESERLFRAVFNSTHELIGVLDRDGTLLQANQAALALGGLKSEDVIGRPFWDTYWWRYSPAVSQRLRNAVLTAAQGTPVGYEEDVLAGDSTLRTIEFTLNPILDEHGETMLIMPEGRDVTERKRAEAEQQLQRDELAHVVRLSTMGEMATGMAHELNQPLAAMVSYCGTALLMLSETSPQPDERLRNMLEQAMEQAHKAGNIIRNLREFVGKKRARKTVIDFDNVVQDVHALLDPILRRANVQLGSRTATPGKTVAANKVQIEQVLINLVVNSIEAIQSAGSGGGNVDLTIQAPDRDFIEVSVTDNGPGIDKGMIDRIFQPYQTSKPSGMGMGLSISRSIVEAHGGKIWVDTGYRGGTRLSFSLPVQR